MHGDNILVRTELLPQKNTNLEVLSIKHNLLHMLAAFILRITSLTYLEIADPLDSDQPVLIVKICAVTCIVIY